MENDSPIEERVRTVYERSREIVRRAHDRAEAAAGRAGAIRESLRRAKTAAEHAATAGANARTATLLQLAAEENARLVEEKDRFMAIVSHELRQPLNAALAASRVMQQHALPPRAEQARAVIHRQLLQIAALVDDFAEMSSLTLRAAELRHEPVDLTEVIEAAAETVRPGEGAPAPRVNLAIRRGLNVHGDRARLYQLFANLLGNALRYTPPEGRIDVTATVDAGYVAIRVADTGRGISAEHLPRIFEPFVRGDETAGEGFGIGLALVRAVAEGHGGTASAASAGPGQGSAFTIRLPLMDSPESAPSGDSPPLR